MTTRTVEIELNENEQFNNSPVIKKRVLGAHWTTSRVETVCFDCGDDVLIGDRIVLEPPTPKNKLKKSAIRCNVCGYNCDGIDNNLPNKRPGEVRGRLFTPRHIGFTKAFSKGNFGLMLGVSSKAILASALDEEKAKVIVNQITKGKDVHTAVGMAMTGWDNKVKAKRPTMPSRRPVPSHIFKNGTKSYSKNHNHNNKSLG